MRYTSPSPPTVSGQIGKEDIPLLDRHIARLKSAWTYFTEKDGREVWGDWPGDEYVWDKIREALRKGEEDGVGDWRVRI